MKYFIKQKLFTVQIKTSNDKNNYIYIYFYFFMIKTLDSCINVKLPYSINAILKVERNKGEYLCNC